jgi:hypothetical protein
MGREGGRRGVVQQCELKGETQTPPHHQTPQYTPHIPHTQHTGAPSSRESARTLYAQGMKDCGLEPSHESIVPPVCTHVLLQSLCSLEHALPTGPIQSPCTASLYAQDRSDPPPSTAPMPHKHMQHIAHLLHASNMPPQSIPSRFSWLSLGGVSGAPGMAR